MNHKIFQHFIDRFDINVFKQELVAHLIAQSISKIDSHIKNNSPDLLVNFNMLYQDLTHTLKAQQVVISNIEKKAKKVFDSSSLAEDVYKLRDEMKAIKKKLDKFNKAMKLASA